MRKLITLTFSAIVAFSASQALACASSNGGRHDKTKATASSNDTGSGSQTKTQKK